MNINSELIIFRVLMPKTLSCHTYILLWFNWIQYRHGKKIVCWSKENARKIWGKSNNKLLSPNYGKACKAKSQPWLAWGKHGLQCLSLYFNNTWRTREHSGQSLKTNLGFSAVKLLDCLYRREFVKIVNFVWEIHNTGIETTEYPSMRNASI